MEGRTQMPTLPQSQTLSQVPEPPPLRWPVASPHPPAESAGLPPLQALGAFWVKINHDWIFNLAGLLAYNFLMAIFPILLLLLAGFGVVLRTISPGDEHTLEQHLANALPGNTGTIIVNAVATHLQRSVGLLLVVGVVTSCLAGSRLFITLENCFGIIFRLRGRSPLQQNLMAVGMLLLYLLLVPVVFLVSVVPADLVGLFDPHRHSAVGTVLLTLARPLVALLAGGLFFGMTYAFVPHRPLRWRTWRRNWKGTVCAAGLLLLYEALFPLAARLLVRPDNYGSIAVFAVMVLLFFYYLAFILLVGAEVNSWSAGQRETAADLPGILHAVQAHGTLRGAAGPTAGLPQEEMQQHKRGRLTRYLGTVIKRARRGRPFPIRRPTSRATAGSIAGRATAHGKPPARGESPARDPARG
jgi:membrane protein